MADKPVRAICAVADGSEDIELTTTTDILVRAGVQVTLASVMPKKEVTLARGLKVISDILIQDAKADDYDLVYCPGGMPGAEHFQKSKPLNDLVVKIKQTGKWYTAICATPNVMFGANADIMKGLTNVTCYPSMQAALQQKHANIKVSSTDRVVVDGKCVTSQGPGTAMAFALKLVELLKGAEKSNEIAKALLFVP